jgi:hypothetical protein
MGSEVLKEVNLLGVPAWYDEGGDLSRSLGSSKMTRHVCEIWTFKYNRCISMGFSFKKKSKLTCWRSSECFGRSDKEILSATVYEQYVKQNAFANANLLVKRVNLSFLFEISKVCP